MDSKVVFIDHPYYGVNNPSNNLKIYKRHKNGDWYYIKCKDKEHYRKELKKIDVKVLRRISEELDISYETLLQAAGYNQVVDVFENKNKPRKKTTKDLLQEYKQSQLDLLEDAYEKRTNVANCSAKLHQMMMMLQNYDYYKEIYPPEKILADGKELYNDLAMSGDKYDYSKLPHD